MESNDFYVYRGELQYYKGSNPEVILPEGITSIGDRAFCDCSSIISNCVNLTIHAPKKSYAMRFAKRKHIPLVEI